MSTKHTPGAIRAAEIITGDNYDSPKGKYDTDHGKKTVVGIADLIDSETAAPELLEALQAILAETQADPLDFKDSLSCSVIRDTAQAAIAKATT